MHLKPFLNLSLNLVVGLSCLFSNTEAADTIKIHLTYKHHINERNQTKGYITVKQQFYTLDDTLFREITYDEVTGQISGYTFYFYKNGRLSSEEHYLENDEAYYALKHVYSPEGHNTITRKLSFSKGMETPAGMIKRRFNREKYSHCL